MENYLRERSILFNLWSEFSCPDSCERMGCKEPDLHISISLIDLLALSWASGRKVSEHFERDTKIGFDPIKDQEPWIGRISLELKMPCNFLNQKICSIYPGRPIACALFPEYSILTGKQEFYLRKEIFRNYPCLKNPCHLSPQRREVLERLFSMSMKEFKVSDFYLFGISPFVIDIKNIVGDSLEGVKISEDGKAHIQHERIEMLLLKKFSEGGYRAKWKDKIKNLDQNENWEILMRIKDVIEQGTSLRLNIAYQFDGNKLLPIHLP